MKVTRSWALIASIALVVLTNAIVLAGAAYNRGGSPDSVLRLSGRELSLPYVAAGDEDSGLALRLGWRVLGAASEPYSMNAPPWLNERKMLDLGFTAYPRSSDRAQDRFQRQVAREVLLVLELDGDAFREALKRAEARASSATNDAEKAEAARALSRERTLYSRLFVVDAGLDAAALRAKYPDRSRYAIVHGRVSPSWMGKDHGGIVSGVDAESITVPLEYRRIFADARASAVSVHDPDAPPPPFVVSVAFGRRLEPWIMAASRIR